MRLVNRNALLGLALGGVLSASLHAAVINDPARVTGTNAIDPAGGQAVDTNPAGSASQAVLEADPTFGAIQNFNTTFTGGNTFPNPQNIVNYADPALPDIALFISGTFSNGASTQSGAGFSSAGITTSSSEGIRLRISDTASTAATLNYLIDFGDNSTGTFDAAANPVDKAGFTLSSIRAGHTATVEFLDPLGNILSTQTVVGSDAADAAGENVGLDALFAYDSDGTPAGAISAVRLSLTSASGSNSANLSTFLDDLGFSAVVAVPEPASLSAAALAAAALLGRRRRHPR